MRWISVSEKLPNSRENVLFCAVFEGTDGLIVCLGYKDSDDPGSNLWWDITAVDNVGDPLDVYSVTHWMPLPEAP